MSSLLALTYQYGNIARSLPKVGYVKSADVYFTVITLFIFCTLIEVALVCFIENKNGQKARKKEMERKAKRMATLKKATNSFSVGTDSLVPEDEKSIRKVASSAGYGSMEQRMPGDHNNDPRLRKESLFTIDEAKPNGNLSTPPQRKTSWASNLLSSTNLLSSRRRNGSFGLDPLHALTALSFGLGMHSDSMEIDATPKWTGERIDAIARKVFPISFLTFNCIYWVYYLLQNNLAKQRALSPLDEL